MELIKSANDTERFYRYITLDNEISVLLVSDRAAKHSAASLDVRVGSFCDPPELPGLAHFLEHMLFMGSAKYPAENAYEKFLSDHGGFANAYTSDEHTCFHFDIESSHFQEALDIFANVFVSPLMDPSATERELMSVHSEDKKNEKVDSWRISQVLSENSNQNHPRSRFGGGNIQSLDTEPKKQGINTRERLLKFHDDYYSSNLMKVALVAPDSLDTLEQWARTIFSQIENKKRPVPSFKQCGNPFESAHLGREIYIQSVKNVRKIQMFWLIEPQHECYFEGNTEYLGHLIGHEGPGSLFSALKKKGWATSLSAGADGEHHEYDLFSIEIGLTEAAFLNHRNEVIEMVFEEIEMLKSHGPQEWVFKELQTINQLEFANLNRKKPSSYATYLTDNMWSYPPKDTLRGPYALDSFNPSKIDAILHHLSPSNMIVLHIGKHFEGIEFDKSEKWYGVKYHARHISTKLIKKWSNMPLNPKFQLPSPNEFIPSDLTVYPLPVDSSSNSTQQKTNGQMVAELENTKIDPNVSSSHNKHSNGHSNNGNTPDNSAVKAKFDPDVICPVPDLIIDTLRTRAWHYQDPLFRTPKLTIRILVASAVTYSSPLNFVMTQLYSSLIADSLNEYVYDSSLAGIDYSVEYGLDGIALSIQGFSQKIPTLLNKFLRRLLKIKFKQDRFDIQKQELLRSYGNFAKHQPWNHASEVVSDLSCHPKWGHTEKHAAATTVDIEDLRHFKKNFLNQIKLEWLLHGNITRDSAIQLVQDSEAIFFPKCNLLYPSQFLVQRSVEFPSGKTVKYSMQGLDPENQNSATYFWFQVCPFFQVRDCCLVSVAAILLEEKIYDVLRTKEQLGYLIWSGAQAVSSSYGWRIVVQSSDFNPDYLESRINAFLNDTAPSYLDSLTDEAFQHQIDATISLRTESPNTLYNRSSRFWGAIVDATYQWKRRLDEVEVLKSITKEEVIDFFKNNILSPLNRKKVVVKVYSKSTQNSNARSEVSLDPTEQTVEDVMEVKDIVAWRNSRPLLAPGCRDDWSKNPAIPEPLAAMKLGNEEDSDESENEDDEDDEGEEEEEEESEEGQAEEKN